MSFSDRRRDLPPQSISDIIAHSYHKIGNILFCLSHWILKVFRSSSRPEHFNELHRKKQMKIRWIRFLSNNQSNFPLLSTCSHFRHSGKGIMGNNGQNGSYFRFRHLIHRWLLADISLSWCFWNFRVLAIILEWSFTKMIDINLENLMWH